MGQEEAGGCPSLHLQSTVGGHREPGQAQSPRAAGQRCPKAGARGSLSLSELGLAHWVSHAPSLLSTRSCSLFPAASAGLLLLQLSSCAVLRTDPDAN